jgi:hypothetical protein
MPRFNQRNGNDLRTLLADDVKLHQRPLRVGRADVGLFFTLYAKIDGAWLAPAGLEGREVIAVFADRADPKPSYICGSSAATVRSLTSMTTAMGFDVDRATA